MIVFSLLKCAACTFGLQIGLTSQIEEFVNRFIMSGKIWLNYSKIAKHFLELGGTWNEVN